METLKCHHERNWLSHFRVSVQGLQPQSAAEPKPASRVTKDAFTLARLFSRGFAT